MNQGNPVVLVTGANRGIGFEICRQLARRGARVVLTSRSAEAGQAALSKLSAEKLNAEHYTLDVTDEKSLQGLREYVESTIGELHVLINNAGILATEDA